MADMASHDEHQIDTPAKSQGPAEKHDRS